MTNLTTRVTNLVNGTKPSTAARAIAGASSDILSLRRNDEAGATRPLSSSENLARCASPDASAAAATAAATAGATSRSKTLGTMYSGLSSSGFTTDAIAWAAASFMPSSIAEARTSRAPRKTPGKARTLLI